MEEKIKKLEKELKFLTKDALRKEIENNKIKLENKDANIKKIANDIYISRGLDVNKINTGIINNLINKINMFFNNFKEKDNITKRKMIIDIIYLIILIILLKIPFNLVRDIGFDYIEIISTNNLFKLLWDLAFLLLYTITAICTSIALLNNFNENYNK